MEAFARAGPILGDGLILAGLQATKDHASNLLEALLAGDIDPKTATAANQLLKTHLEAVKAEVLARRVAATLPSVIDQEPAPESGDEVKKPTVRDRLFGVGHQAFSTEELFQEETLFRHRIDKDADKHNDGVG